jgi:hypothetical protein
MEEHDNGSKIHCFYRLPQHISALNLNTETGLQLSVLKQFTLEGQSKTSYSKQLIILCIVPAQTLLCRKYFESFLHFTKLTKLSTGLFYVKIC